MKKILFILIFLFSLLSTNTIFAETNQSNFTGKVGESEIHMQLYSDAVGKIFGTYYYDLYKKDILLGGSVNNEGFIKLIEYDEFGKCRATFSGVYITPNEIEGAWIDANANLNQADEQPIQIHLIKEGFHPKENSNINYNWDGLWLRNSSKFTSAHINISHNTGNSLWFELGAVSGSHVGRVSGVALIKDNSATFNDGNGGILKLNLENNQIVITQSYGMNYYGGIGVMFSGSYLKGEVNPKETTFKFLSPSQKDIFKEMVNTHYQSFENTAQLVSEQKDLDNFGSHVYVMSVRGLYTIMESIIMVRDDNKMWAAVIKDDKVFYFTNTNRTKTLPLTIEKWRERFKNKTVIYPSSD